MNSSRRFMLALGLSLTAGSGDLPGSLPSGTVSAMAAAQVTTPAGGDGQCPLRAADLDKVTSYRWKLAQYKADQIFPFDNTIRIDYCELVGMDGKGLMRVGVMVNIARGANADAVATHWHAVCAKSLVAEARGKVQPVPGVPGGHRCVTANGSSDLYWIEAPGRSIQIEPLTDGVPWAEIFPQLLAAAR